MHAERRTGFSLLEVLVALAVLSLALAALVRTAGQEARLLAEARERSQAQWIAANLIAEARLAPALPATGRSEGRLAFGGREWSWRMDVSATGVGTLRRLDVEVVPEGDGLGSVRLTGFAGR